MYILGDGRASEQPGLTMIHTIYMREHNRIRDALNQINPHWNHEKLFEEARRIVIASVQHVTYNEFLPRILGWNAMSLYGLKLLPQGYYSDYNPTCNPSVFTEFATAAYRIGHSLLRPHIPRLDNNYNIVEPPILLRDFFFKTDIMMKVKNNYYLLLSIFIELLFFSLGLLMILLVEWYQPQWKILTSL